MRVPAADRRRDGCWCRGRRRAGRRRSRHSSKCGSTAGRRRSSSPRRASAGGYPDPAGTQSRTDEVCIHTDIISSFSSDDEMIRISVWCICYNSRELKPVASSSSISPSLLFARLLHDPQCSFVEIINRAAACNFQY